MERSIFARRIDFDQGRSHFCTAWGGATSLQNPVVAHLEPLRSAKIGFGTA